MTLIVNSHKKYENDNVKENETASAHTKKKRKENQQTKL